MSGGGSRASAEGTTLFGILGQGQPAGPATSGANFLGAGFLYGIAGAPSLASDGSPGFNTRRSAFTSGGGGRASASHTLQDITGQPAVGNAASENSALTSGLLGVGAPGIQP